jgi:hypothetical protein
MVMSAARLERCCPLGPSYRNQVQARRAKDVVRVQRLRTHCPPELLPKGWFLAPCGRWHLTNQPTRITRSEAQRRERAAELLHGCPDVLRVA